MNRFRNYGSFFALAIGLFLTIGQTAQAQSVSGNSIRNIKQSNVSNVRSIAASQAKSPFLGNTAELSNSLEIILPAENDEWLIDGNERIATKTGYPAAIYGETFRVESATPEAQARQYLNANKALLRLNSVDIQNLSLHAVRVDDAGTVVRLRQKYKGVQVNKNAEITVHINRRNVVDFVMNGFQYGIKLADVSPYIPADFAKQQVVNHLVGNIDSFSNNVKYQKNELMVLRHQNTDYLVHRINFSTDEMTGEWEAYVDAKTGNLLKLEDVAIYYRDNENSKNSLPSRRSNSLLATGNGNVFLPDPLTSATTSYGGGYVDASDADSTALNNELVNVTLQGITNTAGTYSLVGPFAEIIDSESPFKGLFTQTSSTFNFNRSQDGFEAVNTYYHVDETMRYLNVTLGLNIMPYQYSGGVRIDPSGLNGADNSNYVSGLGRIAFGEGGVDDAEDADVVVHELGHGLHDWVTSGGLSQVNGLSEGSGDYIAASYSRPYINWTTAQPDYYWTFNWDGHNPFWNGRTHNYSATYPGGLTGSIHADGQIWATVMMRIYDDIGQANADKAFWTGLGMTNGSSNQNDAANAVFSAAFNMGYSSADLQAMRTRFEATGYNIATTAANASISGRVRTQTGRGVGNVYITMTDTEGNIRSARTNMFGYYRFDDVEVGETYVMQVNSKRYRFTQRAVSVSDNIANLDFTADGFGGNSTFENR